MNFTLDSIQQFILQELLSPDNTLEVLDAPAFAADPLVGCAAGDDPLFAQFRSDITPEYLLPQDWMAKAGVEAAPGELRVVSWVLPQTAETKAAQREQSRYPAKPWSANRAFGQAFQNRMAGRLVEWLNQQGIPAVCPAIHPDFRQVTSPRFGFASNWSERHTAYTCGLGTFGLCDGLITARGKAVRLGSVIVKASLTPTPRPYDHYRAYCLYDQGCRACIQRCPAGAITAEGHDKPKCSAYCKQIFQDKRGEFGFDGVYGCGLCQSRVPCADGIPRRAADVSGGAV
ncbi:hypothetical protein B5G43_12240 [Flavonifractor sp. An92]|uniref:hypothetical protein n=1 Tax=Flavonifractor sp. An92 TaxID=1965666 RepID=UPI000B38C941|nr:hypothetical protein [Flavonifractor sp. An92]OUN05563.1 hypothetical protein B5G43_12240 [Flavonifractor sp. An92]